MKKKKKANDNDMPLTGNHAVGYGKPPHHSQFKKGKSGNPKGRPKGSLNPGCIVQDVFNQKVTTTVNGKTRVVPLFEALIIKLVAMAMNGSAQSMKMAFDLFNATYPDGNDNEALSAISSFELTADQLVLIEKSTLLKGVK